MISVDQISGIIMSELEASGLFLVETVIRPGNKISVYIDSMKGVTIDECIKISRFIEKNLNRDEEDYELEVSSPGLSRPLKIFAQYEKNIGRYLEIVKYNGIKLTGKLLQVSPDTILLEIPVSGKAGKKKQPAESKVEEVEFNKIKTAKVDIC